MLEDPASAHRAKVGQDISSDCHRMSLAAVAGRIHNVADEWRKTYIRHRRWGKRRVTLLVRRFILLFDNFVLLTADRDNCTFRLDCLFGIECLSVGYSFPICFGLEMEVRIICVVLILVEPITS
jgi:hypothetical protein